ncbi:MAG: S8 family serine peptidase [Opitutales bacterium]
MKKHLFTRRFALAALLVVGVLVIGWLGLLLPANDEPPSIGDSAEKAAANPGESERPAPRNSPSAAGPDKGGKAEAVAAARMLTAEDFARDYEPPEAHDFGFGSAVAPGPGGTPPATVENGRLVGERPSREPLEFVAGWETPSASGTRRVWIVRDPNLPKYPLTRIEQTVVQREDKRVVTEEGTMVADHLIVRLEEGQTTGALQALMDEWGADVLRSLNIPRAYLIRFDGAEPGVMEAFAEALEAHRAVAYAEPDGHAHLQAFFPDDPLMPDLWGLHNAEQTGGVDDVDIDAPEAWSLGRGSRDVLVGIIDTGIDYTHPDLAANMWTNPGESGLDRLGQDKARNGSDDDGNGYVDDVYGYDFVNDDGDPMDEHFHGTHVAGTVGAVGGNAMGVTGVAWETRLIALKIFHTSGRGDSAFYSDAAQAIAYATEQGARLTNNSWGGTRTSQLVEDAIAEARDADILFVAAAGNASRDIDEIPYYPAVVDLENVITGAAIDHVGDFAFFSNYGVQEVDLGAPGVSIASTVPMRFEDPYGRLNGTSMAAPHVAGALALMFAADPTLTATQARAALIGGVEPLESLDGQTITGGLLNVANAVASLGLVVTETRVQDQIGDEPAEGDGIISPGETVLISLDIKNPSDREHAQVSATLNADDISGLTIVKGSESLGAIPAGVNSVGGEDTFIVAVAPDIETPQVFNIPVTLRSDLGEWRSSVLFEVASRQVASGTVSVEGEPLEGAEITWEPVFDDETDPLLRVVRAGVGGTTTSRADGGWQAVLPEGEYAFSVNYPSAVNPAPITTVLPPNRGDLDFTFLRAEVSGRVLQRSTGEPIPGAIVEYRGAVSGETTTSEDGRYRFEVLLAQAAEIRVRALSDSATPTRWQTFRVPPSEEDVDFFLGAPRVAVSAERLAARATPNGEVTRTFEVRNEGDEPLTFGFFNEEIEAPVRSGGIGSVQRQFTLPLKLHEASLYWPRPYGIAWTGEALWMVNGTSNLFRIDEHDGTLLETVPLDLPNGVLLHGVGWDGRFFWLADYLGRRVFAFDPTKGTIAREFSTAENWSEVNPPNGITFARGKVWVHRGGLHLLDFIRRYASFDPDTGELADNLNFAVYSSKGLHNSFVFDNGRFYHSATNHDDSTIAEGPRDLDALLPRDELDETTRNYEAFESPFESVFDVSTDREGRLWAIGSKTVVDGRAAFMKVALFNGRRNIWLTQSPHQVTLQPGEARAITVRADASMVGQGQHSAVMVLRSNDPAQPELTIPFELDVDNAHGGNRAPAFTSLPPDVAGAFPESILLDAAAGDPDGDELSYRWSKLSGPGEVTFSANGSPAAASTTADFSAPGIYRLEIAVTDGIATTKGEVEVSFIDGGVTQISGTVTLDGEPASGARVHFFGEVRGYVLAGPDGGYTLALPEGTHRVYATLPDAVPAASVVVAIPGGSAPDFAFETATITGRVVDAVTGSLVPEAEVTYRTAGSEGEATVNANAEFELNVVTGQPTEVFLQARRGDHRSAELQAAVPPFAQVVELPVLRPVANVNPASVEVTAAYGERPERKVTLANDGVGPLEWSIRRLLRNLAATDGAASLLDIFTYDAPRGFASVAYGEDTVFICGLDNSIVYRIDARTGEYIDAYEIGDGPSADMMTYDSDRGVIWYGNGGHLLYQMDPETGEVLGEMSMRLTATGPVYHDGLLWVVNKNDSFDGREIIAYNPDNGDFVRRFVADLPDPPSGLEFYNGLIWLPTQNALYLIDPLDGSRVGTVDLDGYPEGNGIAMTGDGTFWLVSGFYLFHWRFEEGPWLEASPQSGVLDPNETAELTLQFDSLLAGEGAHEARLEFRTNDPGAEVVTVPVGFTVTEGDLQTLSGTVTKDGAPVAGAEVKLTGNEREITATDAAGRYSFEVVDGDYHVLARREGWQPHVPKPVKVDGGSKSLDFAWTTGTITGVVTEELTGEALEGVTISWQGPLSGETTTGANGTYTIEEVYAEASEVIVSARADNIDYVATRAIAQPGPANGDLVLFGARLQAEPRDFFIQDQPGDVRTVPLTVRNSGFADGLTWQLDGLDAIGWLSADVLSGELASDEETTVTLTFSIPSELALDTYVESIVLTSNDPGRESTIIPLTLIVTDANEQPSVAITSPDEGASRGYDRVVITAEATDPENAVDRVEFLIDGLKAGEVPGNETPHVFTWAEASVGEHEVVARVVDDQGSVATDSIRIFVGEPPIPMFEADAFPGPAPVTVAFSGVRSLDPDGDIVGYRWDTGEVGGVPSTDGDRVVMIEAEHFHADHREHPGTGKWAGHRYEVIEDPAASNGLAVQGLPDTGVFATGGDEDQEPGLFYGIETTAFFNWQIYARVRNTDSNGNKVRWTMYNERREELYTLGGAWDADDDALLREEDSDYTWIVTDHAESGTNSRTYPMPVMAYMQEDGLVVDKFILTNRSFFDEELEDLENVIDKPEETGSFAITPTTNFTFAEDGEYTLHLSVTDNDGIVRTVSRTIFVGALPEARIAASIQNGSAPLTVNFDGTTSTAPGDAAIVDYRWHFGTEASLGTADFFQPLDDYDRDEVNDGSVDSTDGQELELTGNIWRSLDLPLEITESTLLRFEYRREHAGELHAIGLDDNREHEDALRLFQIDGTNTALPHFIRDFKNYRDGDGWRHYEIPIGLYYTGPVDRLAFVSIDAGFGDSAKVAFRNVEVIEPATASSPTVQFEFVEPGEYTVTLTAVDDQGIEGSTTTRITVAEPVGEPPVILGLSASPSTNAYQHGRIRFTTRANDPEGGALEYRWRSTTAILADWQAEPSAVVRPFQPGSYPIHAQVRDPDGNLVEDSLTVTIDPFPGTGTYADELPEFREFVAGRLRPGDPVPGVLDDLDNNGLPLLAEYLLGGGFGKGARENAPRIAGMSGNDVLLRYARRSDQNDDLMTHWWSDDLLRWHPVGGDDMVTSVTAHEDPALEQVDVRLYGLAGVRPLFVTTSFHVPVPPFTGRFYFEAESGALGDNWAVKTDDPDAFGGAYIEIDGFNRTAMPVTDRAEDNVGYEFTVPEGEGGAFEFWYRILSNSYVDDSFFWRLNGGGWNQENGNPGDAVWRQIDGSVWDALPAGDHLLEITYREDGTRLDAFAVQQAGLGQPEPPAEE